MKKIIDWFKADWWRLIAILGIVLVVFCVVYLPSKGCQSVNPNTTIERRLEALEQGVVLSRTQVEESVSNLESRIESLFIHSQAVLDRLDALGLEPTVVTRTETRVEGQTVTVLVDRFEDIPREFVFRTRDGLQVARYDIVEPAETGGQYQLVAQAYDLDIRTNTVVSMDQDPPAVITETTISSEAEPDHLIPVDVIDSVSYWVPQNGMIFQLEPHLDLMVGVSIGVPDLELDPNISLGISLFSYGNRDEEMLRVIRLGVGVEGDDFGLNLSPVQYNLGWNLPIVSDTWISPSVIYEPFNNTWDIGISLSSTL
jgi:hypothetical protein